LFEYTTVYSREPNTRPDGSARVSVSTVNTASAQLIALLRTNLTSDRLTPVLTAIGAANTPRPRGTPAPAPRRYGSLLAFYMASGMTSDEFALVASSLTVTNATYVLGRVNVNTASPAVLASLPGMSTDLASQLANYRRTNPDKLTSVAWIVDAIGSNNNQALTALAAGDYITTQSYQFTADIAALGPYGRGYRRVKFVFDTTSGTPQLIYRQDLTHLGWGLGKYARQNYLASGKAL
jgi:hypothetical protein